MKKLILQLIVFACLFIPSKATRAQCLSGNYTIGGVGANFPTILSAVNSLNTNGVCGAVTFTVNAGVYQGKFSLTAVPGASISNPISFIGAGSTSTIIEDSVADAVITIARTSYVVFKGFTVNNKYSASSSASCSGIAITSNVSTSPVSKVTIKNCTVNLPNTGINTSFGIIASHAATSASTFSYVDSLTIDSNVLNGATSGIYVYAGFNATSAFHKGHKITNNTVNGAYYNGLYLYSICNPILVSNNQIYMNPTYNGNASGIAFWYCKNRSLTSSTFINNNRIKSPGYGVFSFSDSSTATAPHFIVNNIVSGTMTYVSNYGIYISTSVGGNYRIFHNTVNIKGFGTNVYGLYYNNTNTAGTAEVKNNIFSIQPESGGTTYPVFLAQRQAKNMVNNNLYSNTFNPVYVVNGTLIGYATNYKLDSVGGDASSIGVPVLDSDYAITDACNVGANVGISSDINGISRSVVPTIGAHEFTTKADDIAVQILYSPAKPITLGLQDLIVRVKNVGNTVVNSFNITFTNNSQVVTQTVYTPLNPCDTMLVSFNGPNKIFITNGTNDITVYTDNPGGYLDGDRKNDTLKVSYTYYAPLSGNYTIGGTPGALNFTNFIEAAHALELGGVAGPVYFDVLPGTYVGQVKLNREIIGSSSTNTITFQGSDSSQCIISSSIPGGATVMINQVSNVKLKALTIENNANGICMGIANIGNTYNTNGSSLLISNSIVRLPNSNSAASSYGILVTSDINGATEAAMFCDSIAVNNCIITGAAVGVAITGSANNSANYGIQLTNNLISAITGGVRLVGVYNPISLISNTITTSTATSYGFWVDNNRVTGTTSTLFIANKINTGYRGIYYNSYLSSPANPTKFYNNMIYCAGSAPGQTYGVYLSTATANSGNVDFYHNTIKMAGLGATYALYYSGATSSSNFLNNIFAVNAAATMCAYFGANFNGNTINYNVYYNPFVSGTLVYRGVAHSALTYRQQNTGGDLSYSFKPQFVSETDLHLANSCAIGTNLQSIVGVDIDGASRSTTPIIGADESAGLTNDVAIEEVIIPKPYNTTLRDVNVRVKNFGNTPLGMFNISYKLNNEPVKTMSYTSTILPCETQIVSFSGTDQLALASGKNTLVVYTSLPNSSNDQFLANDTIVLNLSTISNKPGNCLDNGTSRYVRMQNVKLDSLNNFTVETWFKLTTSSSTSMRRIISKSNNANGFDIGVQSGLLTASVWNITGAKSILTASNIPQNRWIHVALTFQGGVGATLFINGERVAFSPNTTSKIIGSVSDLTIGANSWDYSNAINGNVDEVRLWDIAKDSFAVRKDMHRTLRGDEVGLISYVQLNEDMPTTWVSDPVNGSVGILTGSSPVLSASTLPVGGDSTMIFSAVTSANCSNSNLEAYIAEAFDQQADFTITEVPFAPNTLPNVTNKLTNKYWIVRAFDNPGVYAIDLKFTLPSGYINTSDANIGLYRRESNSDTAYWALVSTASTVTATDVSFSGVSVLGQFTIASSGSSPLPVKLVSFSGMKNGVNADLNWVTSSEFNNKGFDVMRSDDGLNYRSIGFVSGLGTTNTINKYRFTDKNVFSVNSAKTYYYQLKQLDNNEQYTWSNIVSLSAERANNLVKLQLLPNPFTDVFTLSVDAHETKNGKITITDMLGNILVNEHLELNAGLNSIVIKQLSTMASGMYFITVEIDGEKSSHKIVKQ